MFTSLRQNIGISLVFVGVTLSMFLNYFYPVIYWTPIIMVSSCILICDRSTFHSTTTWNPIFKKIVTFQLIMLLYFLVSFNEDLAHHIKFKLFSFHMYILVLSFVLMRTQTLRHRDFLLCLFIISGFLAFISAVCHYFDLIAYDKMVNKENAVLEIFTCNISAFVNFSSCLFLLYRFKYKFLLFCFFLIFIDIYVIMMSGKRSYFISVLGVLFLFLYKTRQLKKGIICIVCIYALTVILIPEMRELTMSFFERTIEGFSTVYVDNKSSSVDWDDSASIRAWSQKIALEKFNSFGLMNYLFGGGYYCWFFDNPLGEAYLDMGLIGLYYFSYLIVFMPIKIYFKSSINNYQLLCCILISSMNIFIILTNNDPYNYLMYTPLCMSGMCVNNYSDINSKNV